MRRSSVRVEVTAARRTGYRESRARIPILIQTWHTYLVYVASRSDSLGSIGDDTPGAAAAADAGLPSFPRAERPSRPAAAADFRSALNDWASMFLFFFSGHDTLPRIISASKLPRAAIRSSACMYWLLFTVGAGLSLCVFCFIMFCGVPVVLAELRQWCRRKRNSLFSFLFFVYSFCRD